MSMYQLFSIVKRYSLRSLLLIVSVWSFDSINSSPIFVKVDKLNNTSQDDVNKGLLSRTLL